MNILSKEKNIFPYPLTFPWLLFKQSISVSSASPSKSVACVQALEKLPPRLPISIKTDIESLMPTFQPVSRTSKCITVGVCIALQISFYRHIIATNSSQTAVSLLGTSNNVHAGSYKQHSSMSLQSLHVQFCHFYSEINVFYFWEWQKVYSSPAGVFPLLYIIRQTSCWKHKKYLGWLSSDHKKIQGDYCIDWTWDLRK